VVHVVKGHRIRFVIQNKKLFNKTVLITKLLLKFNPTNLEKILNSIEKIHPSLADMILKKQNFFVKSLLRPLEKKETARLFQKGSQKNKKSKISKIKSIALNKINDDLVTIITNRSEINSSLDPILEKIVKQYKFTNEMIEVPPTLYKNNAYPLLDDFSFNNLDHELIDDFMKNNQHNINTFFNLQGDKCQSLKNENESLHLNFFDFD
jgi:hypothetical protein